METRFKMDGCHSLTVCTRLDPAAVLVEIQYHPLPTLAVSTAETGEQHPGYVYAPTETLAKKILKPSEARAIASALLSAATEART